MIVRDTNGYVLYYREEQKHLPGRHDQSTHGHRYNSKRKLTIRAVSSDEIKKQFDVCSKIFDYAQNNESSGASKARIAKELAATLKNNKPFQTVVKHLIENEGISNPYGIEDPTERVTSHLVQTWAGTSAGTNPLALAMQKAANTLFKLNDAKTDHFYEPYYSRNQYDKLQKGLMEFHKAQYNNTQAFLKKNGIKELVLFRGVTQTDDKKLLSGRGHHTISHLQPASSFAYDPKIAGIFASGGWSSGERLVIGSVVPIQRILGTSMTGYGCKNESEVVVLGGHEDSWTYGRKSPSSSQWASSTEKWATILGTANEAAMQEVTGKMKPKKPKTTKPKTKKELELIEEEYKQTGGDNMVQIDDTNTTIIEVDADSNNADWAKSSWDLNIDNVDDLRAFVLHGGWNSIEDFKKEPVYRNNVNKLPWLKNL